MGYAVDEPKPPSAHDWDESDPWRDTELPEGKIEVEAGGCYTVALRAWGSDDQPRLLRVPLADCVVAF